MHPTRRTYWQWREMELTVRRMREEIYGDCRTVELERLPTLERAQLEAAAMWRAFMSEVDAELQVHRCAA